MLCDISVVMEVVLSGLGQSTVDEFLSPLTSVVTTANLVHVGLGSDTFSVD